MHVYIHNPFHYHLTFGLVKLLDFYYPRSNTELRRQSSLQNIISAFGSLQAGSLAASYHILLNWYYRIAALSFSSCHKKSKTGIRTVSSATLGSALIWCLGESVFSGCDLFWLSPYFISIF